MKKTQKAPKKHENSKVSREFVQKSPRKPAPQNRKRRDRSIDLVARKRETLRERVIVAVLCGLYSDIGSAQKFGAYIHGDKMPLPEMFARIAIAQADALEL